MATNATVQSIVLRGKHGPYFVATADGINGSITCSLKPTVWLEKTAPEPGIIVRLDDLHKKKAGWRATSGRYVNPSDEQKQQSATERSKEMKASSNEQKQFTPFLVEGGYEKRNIFRVMSVNGNATQEQVTAVLVNLPIAFHLRAQGQIIHGEYLNEPLEFYLTGGIAEIFPPRNRVLTSVMLDSWKHPQVHAHELTDIANPGCGQIRSCFHFFPRDLGATDWQETVETEMEIGVNTWPKTKTEELQMPRLSFGKRELRDLVGLISGGKALTAEQYAKWRDLLNYAFQSMRSCYENPFTPTDYSVRVYYTPHFLKFDKVESDEDHANVLNEISDSISWE